MEFSGKYHEESFPERYAGKHAETFARRLNHRREGTLLRRALALTGEHRRVADIGCGPGRFWPVLLQTDAGDLYALDVSHAMLRFAREQSGEDVGREIRLAAGSVLALPFVDDAFDTVVSMRLLHHFGDTGDRRRALSELVRISRRHLIVSLWTDGNYKAWRRRRLEMRRPRRAYQNRHIVPEGVIAEDFAAAGLSEVAHFDLIPRYSQWRYYVLQKDPGRSAQA